MRRRAPAATLAALLLAGCFRTSVHSGLPPGRNDPHHDNQWHSGLVGGLAEISGATDLARACPVGWATVESRTSFVHALLQYVTAEIYSPQGVTVVCATPPAAFPAPSAGYRAAPAPLDSSYPPRASASTFPPAAPPPMKIR